jgi:hypothetical protein
MDLLKKRIRWEICHDHLCPDTVVGAEPTLSAMSEKSIETVCTATERKIFVSCKDCTDKMQAEYDE